MVMSKNGYFCGGSNIDIKLITCNDIIVIPIIIKRYVLHLYFAYLLHPEMDRTEAVICKNITGPALEKPSGRK